MARCACGTATCSCIVKAAPGTGITVSGNGSANRPYLVGQEGSANPLTDIAVLDTPTLDLTISGEGTPTNKRTISGQATQSLTTLKDVTGTPVNGQVPVWRTDHWVFEAQAGTVPGGLPAGGTDGQVLAKQSSAAGDATWETQASGVWGSGELAKFAGPLGDTLGRDIYLDALGKLRSQPNIIFPTAKAATDAPSTYPIGLSLTTLTSAVATAGGWPYSASAEVLTMIRADTPLNTSATGFQIWCRNVGGTSSPQLAELMYRSGADPSGWTPWMSFANASSAAWVDCKAEVRFCTESSAVANTGQRVDYAKYVKIGKTVTYTVTGITGSGTVVNVAILLPPSAGAPKGIQQGPPPGIVGSGGTNVGGGTRMNSALDRLICYETSGSFTDAGANWTMRQQFTYEVV